MSISIKHKSDLDIALKYAYEYLEKHAMPGEIPQAYIRSIANNQVKLAKNWRDIDVDPEELFTALCAKLIESGREIQGIVKDERELFPSFSESQEASKALQESLAPRYMNHCEYDVQRPGSRPFFLRPDFWEWVVGLECDAEYHEAKVINFVANY